MTLPYNITNGQAIDATPVMANFNTLDGRMPAGAGPVAAAGANSDITSLSALSTPLSVAQGGSGVSTVAAGRMVFSPEPVAQCLLVKSGANLVLNPLNGNWVFINGVFYQIPVGGISLAPTGLTPGTLYYIYLTPSLTLEASTTAPAIETTYFTKVKTGDATRLCVGMARPIAGPAFADTPSQRFVLSWFNQGRIDMLTPFPNPTTTTSTTSVELSTSARIEFLTWAGNLVEAGVVGWMFSNGAVGTIINTTYAFDGTLFDAQTLGNTPISGSIHNAGISVKTRALSEGYHYGTAFGYTQAGTGTWNNSSGVGSRTVNFGSTQG